MPSVKLSEQDSELQQNKYEEFIESLQHQRSNVPVSMSMSTADAPDSIENSEHKQDIFNCLANNWSAERIHAFLLQTDGTNISIDAIKEYRNSLPDDVFLPITYLQSKFKELDIEVDAVGELARLLKLKAERLDMALFLESCTHPLNPIVDEQARGYWNLLREYLAIQKGLGFFTVDTASNRLPANVPVGEIPTIHALLELVPTERATSIDADVRELEKV